MPKDKVKAKKPALDPNDFPDYGDYMRAKKELEAKDK